MPKAPLPGEPAKPYTLTEIPGPRSEALLNEFSRIQVYIIITKYKFCYKIKYIIVIQL